MTIVWQFTWLPMANMVFGWHYCYFRIYYYLFMKMVHNLRTLSRTHTPHTIIATASLMPFGKSIFSLVLRRTQNLLLSFIFIYFDVFCCRFSLSFNFWLFNSHTTIQSHCSHSHVLSSLCFSSWHDSMLLFFFVRTMPIFSQKQI